MMKKKKSELAARLRELKTAVTELQAKIMRDPRTKNVVGFAALAVLAAAVFTFAAPPAGKPEPAREAGYLIPWVKFPFRDGNTLRYEPQPSGYEVAVMRRQGDKTLVRTHVMGAKKISCDAWIPSCEISATKPETETIRMIWATLSASGPTEKERILSASAQQIVDWVKSGSPEVAKDLQADAKMKGYYKGIFVAPSDILRELVPVTGPEEVSMRAEIERLGFVPRKQTQGMDVCALHAVANALEIIDRKDGRMERPSLAFLRALEPPTSQSSEAGAADSAHLALDVAVRGVCSEADYPFSKLMPAVLPPAEIRAKALARPLPIVRGLSNFARVPHLNSFQVGDWGWEAAHMIATQLVMHEIKNGRPVVVGCGLPKSLGPDGKITYRNYSAEGAAHVAVIVGYKTEDGSFENTRFEIVNSWGPGWGDKGYATIDATSLISCTDMFSLELR